MSIDVVTPDQSRGSDGRADSDKPRATYADIEAAPENLVAEIIAGTLFTRSHGHMAPCSVRTMLIYALYGATQSRGNPEASWQIVPLPELHFGSDVLVPEIAAWSVARMPFLPDDHSNIAPDWVCELASSDARRNPALFSKLEIYRRLGVRHIWRIDLSTLRMSVTDNRQQPPVMTLFDLAGPVSAPPFDAISFSFADLWPFDRPLGFNEDPQALYAGDR